MIRCKTQHMHISGSAVQDVCRPAAHSLPNVNSKCKAEEAAWDSLLKSSKDDGTCDDGAKEYFRLMSKGGWVQRDGTVDALSRWPDMGTVFEKLGLIEANSRDWCSSLWKKPLTFFPWTVDGLCSCKSFASVDMLWMKYVACIAQERQGMRPGRLHNVHVRRCGMLWQNGMAHCSPRPQRRSLTAALYTALQCSLTCAR